LVKYADGMSVSNIYAFPRWVGSEVKIVMLTFLNPYNQTLPHSNLEVYSTLSHERATEIKTRV
jgi:hypothetical protein